MYCALPNAFLPNAGTQAAAMALLDAPLWGVRRLGVGLAVQCQGVTRDIRMTVRLGTG